MGATVGADVSVDELAAQSLRQDGPLLDVELYAMCEDGSLCPPVQGKALVDTGADHTAVDTSALAGARTSGSYLAQGATSEAVRLPIYDVLLGFPGTTLEDVVVEHAAGTAHLKSQGLVALLGRDVLERGVLTHDGPAGAFSLRLPGGRAEVRSTPLAGLAAAGLGAIAFGAAVMWILTPPCPR